MTKVWLCALLALGTIGCRGIDGRLDVNEDFVLTQDGKHLLDLNEGTQGATVSIKERRRDYKFKIKLADKQKATFKIDKSDDIPENGDFFFASEDTGLNADLAGSVLTQREVDGPFRDRETCTYTDYRRVCYIEDGRNGRRRRVCRTEPYTRHGWQTVEYDIERTQIDVELDIQANNNETPVAGFNGQTRYSQKRYYYRGQCF